MLSYEEFSSSGDIAMECSPSGECDPNYYVICPPDVDECSPDDVCRPDVNECGPDYDENCVLDCHPQE